MGASANARTLHAVGIILSGERHSPSGSPGGPARYKSTSLIMENSDNTAYGESDAATCSPSSLTPETDAMVAADLHHLEDDETCPATSYWRMTGLARTLERERDEAQETIATMEIRHAAVMLHTQSIVDDANQCREQRDRLAEALRKLADCDWVITPHDRMDAVREIARKALQSLTPNEKQ